MAPALDAQAKLAEVTPADALRLARGAGKSLFMDAVNEHDESMTERDTPPVNVLLVVRRPITTLSLYMIGGLEADVFSAL